MEDFARRRGWCRRGETFSFRKAFRTRFMPFLARAGARRERNLCRLAALETGAGLAEQDFIPLLRYHAKGRPASNADVCMHSRGPLRPSATTNSLIARLSPGDTPGIWSSFGQPCSSDYRPIHLPT
jgi:hypothetical protein